MVYAGTGVMFRAGSWRKDSFDKLDGKVTASLAAGWQVRTGGAVLRSDPVTHSLLDQSKILPFIILIQIQQFSRGHSGSLD